ncbi:MAG: hypothetical protein PF637_04745 [Spirochaetes bacterium]|jgi:hypothetical protein|nr:hypothetical protein [Spirochaetota bacterium]
MKKLLSFIALALLVFTLVSCADEDEEKVDEEIKNAILDLQDAYNSGDEAEVAVLFSDGSNTGGSGSASYDTLTAMVDTLEFYDIETSSSGDNGSATAKFDDNLGIAHNCAFTLVKNGDYWDFTEWKTDGETTLDRK